MTSRCDLLIAGGGPSGSTTALCAARAGLRVTLLDKSRHPRFHVGESFLPQTSELLGELGLGDDFARLTHTRKVGASLMFADEVEPTTFFFENGMADSPGVSFNIERAPFDKMLLDAAKREGAEVIEGVGVDRIESLDGNGVRLSTSAGPFEAPLLIDATGQNTLVGRKLGTRERMKGFENVSYFTHVTGVPRREAPLDGVPIFALCEEGWFWLIPIDETRTSVGVVLEASTARRAGVPARRMLRWACGRCPAVWSLLQETDLSEPNYVEADFSYSCKPYAGPGYALVGDSSIFIDPVFSTGVCLGMMSAIEAVRLAPDMMAGGAKAKAAARAYHAYVDRNSGQYLRLIRGFYTQPFRELFMEGKGPLDVHRAVTTVLAGHVFPAPSMAVRWRWRLFEMLVALHARVGLVNRRTAWSLLDAPATNDEAMRVEHEMVSA